MRTYHLLLPLLGLFLGREFFTIVPIRLPVQVMRVLDGDTVELRGGERVRLASIDAPEKGQPTRVGGGDAGKFAALCLARALRGRSWRLEPRGRDMYGRQLAELWAEEERLTLQLIELGCVSVYPFHDEPELWRAYHQARRKRVGLWAFGGFMRPYWWRKKKSHRSGFSQKREEKRVARRPVATR